MSVDCEREGAEGTGEVLGSPVLVDVLPATVFQVVQDEREELGWCGKSRVSRVWVRPPVLPHHTFDKRTPSLVLLQLDKLLVVDRGEPGKWMPGGKVVKLPSKDSHLTITMEVSFFQAGSSSSFFGGGHS